MLDLHYDQPLYRPPSEASSLILQVTLGCSWNRCTFCEMYTEKRFRPRPEAEVLATIRKVGDAGLPVRRVFLADGDAMVLSTRRLMAVLEAVRRYLPGVRRVSCYALPRQLSHKSPADLAALAEAGLTLVYVGVESGDDEVLRRVHKGETLESTVEGLVRAGEAGIRRSVMILNGLGGRRLARQHAVHSAEVLNASQPEYAAVLVVMFPRGEERFRDAFGADYEPQTQAELLQEMETFLEHTSLRSTVFRSDHASNYLVLKGVLGRDRDRLVQQVRAAMVDPTGKALRAEWQRGL